MKTSILKNREKEILRDLLYLLKKDLDPGKIVLFGSRAKKKYPDSSDFDIALDAKKINISKLRELKEKIEVISGLYKVDLVFLDDVDREFRAMILKKGKILYER